MADSRTPLEAFKEAVRLAGGQAPLARIVGCTQGAIWQRLNSGKPMADTWVLKAEAATGVSRHELRPDLYPDESDRPPVRPDRTVPTNSTDELAPAR